MRQIHAAVAATLIMLGSNLLITSTQAQTIPAGIPSRIEVHALPSVTLENDEFLTGSSKGKPVTLAGELRLPVSTAAKFPAVVLVHGSGGVGGAMDMWIHHLNQAGIATFVVDTFSGRGIVSTVQDQTQLGSLAMMVDAYKSLDLLASHPRIDVKHIYVMGFSKGAVASIFSASTRFKQMYGGQAQFAGHIGLYTPCNTRYMGDTEVTGAPMRLFHGITDDYVNIIPCRGFVNELKKKGVDVTLTEFPNSDHSYDGPLTPKRLEIPKAQSTRNCKFFEDKPGNIVNESSKLSFSYSDPCIAMGAHVGYNPKSTKETIKAVLDFIKATANKT
jgi:dienelactone hydrolase